MNFTLRTKVSIPAAAHERSPDGKRLYVLATGPEELVVFDL